MGGPGAGDGKTSFLCVMTDGHFPGAFQPLFYDPHNIDVDLTRHLTNPSVRGVTEIFARVVMPFVHGAESFVQQLHHCPFNVNVYSMLVGGRNLA